jgi:hypothetical protein
MFMKVRTKVVVCFLSCALLTNISVRRAFSGEDNSKGRRDCWSAEKSLLAGLGLDQDVNDSEIIRLLDIPVKRISAATLVRYRKIYVATPKLLQIVNDDTIFFPAKVAAAKALCDFGNKEWIGTIKTLVTDPNSIVARTSYAIELGGLLARAGDYSQFELVAKGISDTKWWMRFRAVRALANFRHRTDPVTDSAVELLVSVAASDIVPRLREEAIRSLDKIANVRGGVESKVIEASAANINSVDKNLRTTCRAMLLKYRQQPKKE